jgi:hypothetical protein
MTESDILQVKLECLRQALNKSSDTVRESKVAVSTKAVVEDAEQFWAFVRPVDD